MEFGLDSLRVGVWWEASFLTTWRHRILLFCGPTIPEGRSVLGSVLFIGMSQPWHLGLMTALWRAAPYLGRCSVTSLVSVDTSGTAGNPPSRLSQPKVSPNLVWWPLGRSRIAPPSPSEPAGRQRETGAWRMAGTFISCHSCPHAMSHNLVTWSRRTMKGKEAGFDALTAAVPHHLCPVSKHRGTLACGQMCAHTCTRTHTHTHTLSELLTPGNPSLHREGKGEGGDA